MELGVSYICGSNEIKQIFCEECRKLENKQSARELYLKRRFEVFDLDEFYQELQELSLMEVFKEIKG